MKYPDHFPSFVHQLQGRLKRGAEVYGDQTFQAPPEDVISEIQEELLDVCGWAYCLWLRLEKVRRALPPLLLLLCVGCYAVVPDWNTRPKGMNRRHEPEFRAWAIPRFGPEGEVVIYARANHAPGWQGAELEIRWAKARVVLAPEPDLSWAFRGRWPAGRHKFTLRLLLDGQGVAETHAKVNLTEELEDGEMRGWKESPW